MKLARKTRGGRIFRLQPKICVFLFAIMMMAMPAFAEEAALLPGIQISPEISLLVSDTGALRLKSEAKGVTVTITITPGRPVCEEAPVAEVEWVAARDNTSRFIRAETKLQMIIGVTGEIASTHLYTLRVPKKKKSTMNAQAEMPVRTKKEVALNKMAGQLLVSVVARLEEAIRSGKLETAPESAEMLVLKRDIQALMAQPLATVYRTPRKKAASAAASSE